MLRHVPRSGAATALAALLLSVAAGVANAHAELDTANPEDKSAIVGQPSEIVLTFTEPLDPAKSSIKLANASGSIVAQGSSVDVSDRKTMRLPLPAALPAGAYTVRWISASALDGDLDHGTTTFKILPGTPIVTIVPTASPSSPASTIPSEAPTATATATSSPAPDSGASTSDVVIPIVAALVIVMGLGAWLLRGRGRGAA